MRQLGYWLGVTWHLSVRSCHFKIIGHVYQLNCSSNELTYHSTWQKWTPEKLHLQLRYLKNSLFLEYFQHKWRFSGVHFCKVDWYSMIESNCPKSKCFVWSNYLIFFCFLTSYSTVMVGHFGIDNFLLRIEHFESKIQIQNF